MGVYERARRETRESIIREFWGLYIECPISKITVQRVADACGINRSTLYFHFHDVYAILEAIEEPLIDRVRAIDATQGDSTEGLKRVGRLLFDEYRDKRSYLRVLVTEGRDPVFAARYRAEIVRMMVGLAREPSEGDGVLQESVVRIAASAVIELFLQCADDANVSFEDTSRLLEGLMSRGLRGTLMYDFGVTGACSPL